MWEAAKTFAGWKKSGGPTSLSVNGELTSKNDKMAQAQQDFFLKKIETHKKKIPPTKKDPLQYARKFLEDKFVPEFGIGSCFDFEVIRVIERLNPTDACGEDDISSNCLKEINGCGRFMKLSKLGKASKSKIRKKKYKNVFKK